MGQGPQGRRPIKGTMSDFKRRSRAEIVKIEIFLINGEKLVTSGEAAKSITFSGDFSQGAKPRSETSGMVIHSNAFSACYEARSAEVTKEKR